MVDAGIKMASELPGMAFRLLQRQGNILKVEGLDAIDGIPVIDIKPYIPGYDSVANTKIPPWITSW